ncbi:restin homolog [Metopolophium dirhodum]|uniref:restin homolog n=1 Tax=Metopolophium dirhodum TaxID=44670 RepID=UPI0029902B50|nr:restin homolog [Metopolophium dirhodum]
MIELSDENEKMISDTTLIENNLKEKTSLVSNLKNELNELKIQYNKLEEHNQAYKEQICYTYDIDSELRNGKRNIMNEINLLEPGKITCVLTDHNLSNLLDIFVSLIMTKEQQIVTDLVNDHNKVKRLYEDQIKQFQEDIKKGKEWQELVENDNEKLSLEFENLKSQKHNFPCRELKIKELTEKVLEAENLSFNYLNELKELKTQLTKTSKHNYQSLSDEFETFKTSSELSIQDLKNKLENITKQYNESLVMYKDQKDCCYSLEDKIEKIQSECVCLKLVIDKKDKDIKNLLGGFQLKTNEYETMIEKYSLQKEETKIHHEKIINELELDVSNIKHQMYCTENVLKEIKKNDGEYEFMLEEVKSKDNKIAELLTQLDRLKQKIVLLTEERDFLKHKSEQFKNFKDDVKKLNEEIFGYEQNISNLRKDKGHLIIQHDKELKKLKNELNQVQTKNSELSNEYSKLSETAKILEKSLKEDIQQLNSCIVDKNAKISTLELFSKTNTDDLKKKNQELENIFKRARDENNALLRDLCRLKEITNVTRVDQFTQTAEEQSLVSSAIVADHKSMIEKNAKFEKDSKMMKIILHINKAKIGLLEKKLNERHG